MRISRRWAVFFSASALVGLALAPGWLGRAGDGALALAIFSFFRGLCHQRADRSLVLFGAQAAVCIRCLGIYSGAAVGGLLGMPSKTALRLLGAALVVNCLDVAAEFVGFHGNLPLLRLAIGAVLGTAVGAVFAADFFVLPAAPPVPRL
jgi:uncharacterized membrane protein